MPWKSGNRGCFIIEMTVPTVGLVRKSSGTKSLEVFQRRLTCLRWLRAQHRYDVFRDLKEGVTTVDDVCRAVELENRGTPIIRLREIRACWSYLIQIHPDGQSGPIKIGKSTNIAARLKTLQMGSPFPLAVLAARPGAGHEYWLHRRYAEIAIGGEWFREDERLYALAAEWQAEFPVDKHGNDLRRVEAERPTSPERKTARRKNRSRQYWQEKGAVSPSTTKPKETS